MEKSIFSKIGLLVLSLGTIGASVGISLANSKSDVKVPVTFVASDSSGYNTEVKIGDYNYKFKGQIDQKTNKFTLKGTVVGRAKASSGNGGMGGFGGGGMLGQGGFGPGGQEQGGQGGQEQGPTVDVTSVTVTLDKSECYIGETIKATAEVLPADATTKDVEWKSSDEEIATVSNGTITTLKAGTVTIIATSKADPTKTSSATLTIVTEDYTPYEYTLNGTYEIDKGYGYVLTLDDGKNTKIHCDYNKTEGRHEFYYTVNTPAGEGFVKFQAKDITYKSQLASNYKIWDIRDSKYVFTALATGNNGSKAYAYMYLHSDGTAVVNTPSGVNRSVEYGLTWEEDANKNIVVKKGEETYTAVKSVNNDHPGYKLVYGSYAFLNSQSESVKWKNLTISDFDGATTAEFKGTYTVSGPDGGEKEVSLNLCVDGTAKLYVGSWAPSSTGTWTVSNGVYTVVLGEGQEQKTLVSAADGTITYSMTVSSMFGSSVVDCVLTNNK